MESPRELTAYLFHRLAGRRFLWYVFAISLLIRVVFVFWNPSERKIDLYEHGDIAHNLVAGHGFAMHWPYDTFDSLRQLQKKLPPTHEGAFLPPVNPYILAGFYVTFGENQTALLLYRLLMCIISALVPIAIYSLTKSFASEKVARLAAILAVINLFAAFAVTTYSGSSLYQLIAPLSILSLLAALKKKSIGSYVLVGVLSGILTLLRSEYFLMGPFLILVSALMAEKRSRVRIQFVAVALVAHSFVIAPWVLRNYQLFDKFVPVLSHPWYEVWRGNNPRANGTTADATGRSIWVDSVHDRSIVQAMDSLQYDERFEVAADSIFKTKVLDFWRSNPIHAMGLGFKKIAMFSTSDFHTTLMVDSAYAATSFLFFWSAILGMIVHWRRRNQGNTAATVLFALFFAYYLTLTFFTVMLPRYQIFVLNTMLPMTASGLLVLSESVWKRRIAN